MITPNLVMYAAFCLFAIAVLLFMTGLMFCAFLWTANKFVCTYTCVRAAQEAYRQGRDPFWPFWRSKAREMKVDQE